jgi:hypothetical protein
MSNQLTDREYDQRRREQEQGNYDGRFEQRASAALIAAAPDLLAALRELTNAHSYDSPLKLRKAAYIQARAAIAKAEGQH